MYMLSIESILLQKEVLMILADRLKGADYDTKLLALTALDIQVTLQPDHNIVLTGIIPTKEHQIMQSAPVYGDPRGSDGQTGRVPSRGRRRERPA